MGKNGVKIEHIIAGETFPMAGDGFNAGGGWPMSGRPCDSCKDTAAILFCRADSAYLCLTCDVKIHGANKLASRHERVSMCEVCEQAPASVTCKADAAALCVTCDADIHSANPLSRRHERFPVVPFYETAAKVKPDTSSLLVPAVDPETLLKSVDGIEEDDEDDAEAETEAEAASWLLPNPKICSQEGRTGSFIDGEVKTGDFFFPEVDPYLDLDYASSMDKRFQQQSGTDSVVPVPVHLSSDQCLDMGFSRSKSGYSYNSHSVSSSSMDVGVVPDGSAMTDVSNPCSSNAKTGIDLGTGAPQKLAQFSPLDREARVLRYREKRKNRKFEKTIRYASRKAYAETRPRIKGRFAKRTEIELEVDRIYSSAAALLVETGYGVVPTI